MLNALACGLFGAASSVLGKMALSDNVVLQWLMLVCNANNIEDGLTIQGLIYLVRVVLFGMMMLSNAAMIASFLKSMEKNASVTVTVVSNAVNYLASGAAGLLIFGEAVGSFWIVGSLCICLGLCMIVISQEGLPKMRAAR